MTKSLIWGIVEFLIGFFVGPFIAISINILIRLLLPDSSLAGIINYVVYAITLIILFLVRKLAGLGYLINITLISIFKDEIYSWFGIQY